MSFPVTEARWCSKCKTLQSNSDFYPDKHNSSGYKSWCKTCNYKSVRAYYKKNPDVRKKQHKWENLRRKFRMSQERYERHLKAIGGRCEICGSLLETLGRKGSRALHVDHDHKTDRVRGFLCSQCNRGLGYFGDSIEGLMAAVTYLKIAEGRDLGGRCKDADQDERRQPRPEAV